MAQLSARLGVKNLDREVLFYEALGFDVDRGKNSARVDLGSSALTLQAYEELRVADRALLDWPKDPGVFGQGIQLYVLVTDVDAISEKIPVGISQPWPVQDKPWGLRELTLKTPSGFLLTFAQRLR